MVALVIAGGVGVSDQVLKAKEWSWLLVGGPAESSGDGRLTRPTVSLQGLLRRNGALWQHVQLLQGQLHLLLRHLPLPLLLRAPEEPAGPGVVQQLQVPRMGGHAGPRHRGCGQQARPWLRDAAAAEQQVRVRPSRVNSRGFLSFKETHADPLLYFCLRKILVRFFSFLAPQMHCRMKLASSHYAEVDENTARILTWIREMAEKNMCIAISKFIRLLPNVSFTPQPWHLPFLQCQYICMSKLLK